MGYDERENEEQKPNHPCHCQNKHILKEMNDFSSSSS